MGGREAGSSTEDGESGSSGPNQGSAFSYLVPYLELSVKSAHSHISCKGAGVDTVCCLLKAIYNQFFLDFLY